MQHNAHRLFHQANGDACLRRELVITDGQKAKLLECRRKVREALRAGLGKAGALLPSNEFFDEWAVASNLINEARERQLRPKFRTQGSYAYDTLNRPAKACQQIDLDEGMYIPMSVVKGAGPAVASAALFKLVEGILGELCEKEGWTLDNSKSICVRLEVDAETHIDVNIYAIPDSQMVFLEKAAASSYNRALDSSFPINDANRRRLLRLDPNEVYVAHRRHGWEQSDPLELEDWFNDAVDRLSAWCDLRRIVRYLKAWRDERWDTCTLSSLALMVCAVEALDEANIKPQKNRDDDGLLVVARALPHKVTGVIANPVVDDKALNDNWSVTDRNQFELAARVLRDEMEAAMEKEASAQGVLGRIRRLFGNRVPNNPGLIAAVGASISSILATPAKSMPSPKVGVSTSG